jgi:hypothetical protein
MNLPGSPAARKAEEIVRERARMDTIDRIRAMEAKLDSALHDATLAIKKEASPSPVQDLALAIGQDRILLPPAVIVSRVLTEDGDEIATAIRVGRLTFTIEEAVRLGVLSPDGRFSHSRATALLHSTPEPGAWVRCWEARA